MGNNLPMVNSAVGCPISHMYCLNNALIDGVLFQHVYAKARGTNLKSLVSMFSPDLGLVDKVNKMVALIS